MIPDQRVHQQEDDTKSTCKGMQLENKIPHNSHCFCCIQFVQQTGEVDIEKDRSAKQPDNLSWYYI